MISIILTREQWQATINMLAEQPFKFSAPIIAAIQTQLMEQDTMPPGAHRVNGAQEAIPGQE